MPFRLTARYLFFLLIIVLLIITCGQVRAAEQNGSVPAFTMEIRLSGASGPVVDRPLVFGDVINAQVWLPLMGSADKPILANIIWQLYDETGAAVAGAGSVRQLLEMGGEELLTFKLPIKGLVNGKYYLALTHQQAVNPDIFFQASQKFKVNQEVAVTRLVVDESPEGMKNHAILYEDQSVYIFVYFTLADTVSKGRIVLDIIDRQTNKLIATRTVTQKKDYLKDEQRLGVHFAPNFFHAGDELLVRALLTTTGGSAQAQSIFAIHGISLTVKFPAQIKSGATGRYKIVAPYSFAAPFTVYFQGSDGLKFADHNRLTGTFLAVGDGGEQTVDVVVVDKNGRQASATVTVNILADPKRLLLNKAKAKDVPPSYSVPAQGGMVGSSSPQQY